MKGILQRVLRRVFVDPSQERNRLGEHAEPLTEKQKIHLQWYPLPHTFAVVTWGCAATSWLAHVLNSHPDIYCVHAANGFWSSLGGLPRLDGLKYLRIIGSQGYSCKAAGDVHGISLETVGAIQAALGDRFSCAVVVREPIVRLHSQRALFAELARHRPWDVDYVEAKFGGLALPDRSYETRLFVHGANMLNRVVVERAAAPIYRSEDLTSDPQALKKFVEFITGGDVAPSEEWAETMVRRPSLNVHRARERKAVGFESWQIDVIRAVVEPQAWRIYAELGYPPPDFVADLIDTK